MNEPNLNDNMEKGDFKDLLRDVIVPKIELISIIILTLGIILKYLKTSNPDILLSVALTTLAVTSYLYSYLHKTSGLLQTITIRLGCISCAVVLVGIMFTLLHLPGNTTMLNIGLISLGAASGLLVYKMVTEPSEFIKKSGFRYLIILMAGLLFYFQSI